MQDSNDEMEEWKMRILLDLKQLEVLEVSDIFVTQTIKVFDNALGFEKELSVPSCIQFTSTDKEDQYYVIFECMNTANCVIREAFATGKLDLTNYTDCLLVNPDLKDKYVKKILTRLGIEV